MVSLEWRSAGFLQDGQTAFATLENSRLKSGVSSAAEATESFDELACAGWIAVSYTHLTLPTILLV